MSKRIIKEKLRLERDPPERISFHFNPKNYRHLIFELPGPPDTPYENGLFEGEMYLPKNYPMVPPKCHFNTKIWHPNIDKLGRISLEILKNK